MSSSSRILPGMTPPGGGKYPKISPTPEYVVMKVARPDAKTLNGDSVLVIDIEVKPDEIIR